ncbi:hypothetical protein XELAEV_18043591mg [Xenopus laevis]|uniref:Tyrosine-protein kinase n=1 Tax=Xenopus laevis TaxID=8355 RepID=A0A974H2J0_XENLA|nr:hypothetical protein XELAEV_18043591mg [Xenopus laevis]
MESFLRKRLNCMNCLWDMIWPPPSTNDSIFVITPQSSFISTTDTVRVLYSFNARSTNELTIKQGEVLCKLSDEGDYIMARKLTGSMESGLVPRSYVTQSSLPDGHYSIQEPWYFEVANRNEAERLLMSPPNAHGSFLVRPSDRIPGQYSLSVRNENKVTHFRISVSAMGKFYIQNERLFASIEELISFYKVNWKVIKSPLAQACVSFSWYPSPTLNLIVRSYDYSFDRSIVGTSVNPSTSILKDFTSTVEYRGLINPRYSTLGKCAPLCTYCSSTSKEKNKKGRRTNEYNRADLHMVEYRGLTNIDFDEWERPHSEFKLVKELGSGNFGVVWEGLWNDKYEVAIKTLKQDNINESDFKKEVEVLKGLCHRNLIKLYAVCSIEDPVYIVTELMSKGSLLQFLRGDEGHNLNNAKFMHIISQVADGMAYLENIHLVHRDLAARNVLVGEELLCKIADFGLARLLKDDYYLVQCNKNIPIRWTAPEALTHCKYSTKSDVWSYGIVLYEVFMLGQQPYQGMNNNDTLDKVRSGHRLPKPDRCSRAIYSVMMECWAENPKQRPSFYEIVEKLTAIQRRVR